MKKRFTLLFLALCLLCLPLFLGSSQHTWTPQMDNLAHQTEQQFNLPHGLCKAEALQESNWDPTATREEGGYFNQGSRYSTTIATQSAAFLNAHPEYDNTLAIERAQRSISFGCFQVMGENFREMGYDKENINPTLEEQFYYFGKFVTPIWKKYHSVAQIAAAYNTGNPNKTGRSYDKNVVKYQQQFSY